MTIILITGGNRGIGYGTVEVLAKQIPDATILMGCRSAAKAAEPIAKLKQTGITATIEPLEITTTDDSSIKSAVDNVTTKYGRLDVLINNAGAITLFNSDDPTVIRKAWAEGIDCLLTSNVIVTTAFLPLLRKAEWGRVVMVSSTLGSLAKNKALELPPSASWVYNCSKAALNLATIEFHNKELREVADEKDRVSFWTVCPGFCKTEMNGFQGYKTPQEGAAVTARLVGSKHGEIPSGTYWALEEGNFQQIPW